MFHGLVLGALLASTLVAPTTDPLRLDLSAPPPTAKITIDVVTVLGSGCPAGTAAVAPASDNTAFTVTYSDYLAQVGVGAKPTDFRKNCQLSLLIHVPSGFTYAIAQADYRGFASLEEGATGLERASYYFQGTSPTATVSHYFTGPFVDSWQTTDRTDVAAMVFAPCGVDRNLNVNTELRALSGTSDTAATTSFMSMDSTDAAVNTVYHLAWKTCA